MFKKITISIILFLSIFSTYGQLSTNTGNGNANTETFDMGARGTTLGLHFRLSFVDTLAANLYNGGILKNISGFEILVGDLLYLRSQDKTIWLKQIGSESTSLGCYTLIRGGIVTWTGSGLVLDVSPADYIINCKLYHSPQTQITLSASNPSLNRIDLIVGDTLGHVVVITGVPAAPAVKPQANPSSQIEFTSITVSAGATTPSGVTQTIVYNENTEWTSTNALSSGTVNFNSTVNPFNGTINALLTNANGQIYWTNGSPVNSSSYTSLKLYIRVSSGGANPAVNVFVNSSGGGVSPAPVSATVYGFNPSLRDVYQVITIPINNVVTGSFNRVGLVIVSSQVMNVDYVQLQGGIPIGNNPWVTSVFKKPPTDSVFYMVNGVPIFAFIDSTGSNLFTTNNYDNYNVPFASTSFTDSTLTSTLQSGTSYYFNDGLWLNGTYSGSIEDSYLSAFNYGHLINEKFTQKLIFQVGDSSTDIKIGIGVKANQASNNDFNLATYISGTIGNSSTTLNNFNAGSGSNKTGVIINKGDFVELQVNQVADSVIVYYRNLTTNNSLSVSRKADFFGISYLSLIGYPTIFFAKGNLKLISYNVSIANLNYIVLGNSIGAGYRSSVYDSTHVNQLRRFTNATINNAARAGSTTFDYLTVKNNFSFQNKTVLLDGVFGNDLAIGFTVAQVKANYMQLVSSLRANGNRIVHIDNPYRTIFLGPGGWPQLNALNLWIDTAFKGIDTIIHVNNTLSYPADYADGVHPNLIGHTKLANRILAGAPFLFELLTPSTATIVDTNYYKPDVIDTSGNHFKASWANFGGTSFTLTDGSGTTANGTAVDLGGTLASDSHINMDANQMFFDSGNGVFINNDFKVGDNSTGITSSAVGEFKSTNSGLLIPRMNTSQQNAISGPATGLLIWNTDSLTITQYNGTAWRKLIGTTSGTVTNVSALTLGTTGTDLSSSVANSTTTPVITLNVPTASASNRGALSSTDWSTFNNKQPALGNFTANQLLFGQGTSIPNTSSNLTYPSTAAGVAIGGVSGGGGIVINGDNARLMLTGTGTQGVQFTNNGFTGSLLYNSSLDMYISLAGYGSNIYWKQSNGFTGINNSSPTEQLDISGNTKTFHLVGGSSAPTIAAGTGAGTSPTISITGTDLAGYITVTTGTLPSLSATIATITFNAAYGSAPRYIGLSAGNGTTAALTGANMVFVDQSAIATTTFTITSGTTSLTPATTYKFFYNIVQ